MIRSHWRGALVMVMAWLGLAWSQSLLPSASGSGNQPERIMTVHENGQSLRCRVLLTWEVAGKKAYQLQVIATGELLTLTEDGAATTLNNGKDGKQVRALPMRIFHWSRNGTPPAGCPLPPEGFTIAEAVAPQEIKPAHRPAPPLPATSAAVVTPATFPSPTSQGAGGVQIPGRPAVSSTNVKEQIIWWEEKDSRFQDLVPAPAPGKITQQIVPRNTGATSQPVAVSHPTQSPVMRPMPVKTNDRQGFFSGKFFKTGPIFGGPGSAPAKFPTSVVSPGDSGTKYETVCSVKTTPAPRLTPLGWIPWPGPQSKASTVGQAPAAGSVQGYGGKPSLPQEGVIQASAVPPQRAGTPSQPAHAAGPSLPPLSGGHPRVEKKYETTPSAPHAPKVRVFPGVFAKQPSAQHPSPHPLPAKTPSSHVPEGVIQASVAPPQRAGTPPQPAYAAGPSLPTLPAGQPRVEQKYETAPTAPNAPKLRVFPGLFAKQPSTQDPSPHPLPGKTPSSYVQGPERAPSLMPAAAALNQAKPAPSSLPKMQPSGPEAGLLGKYAGKKTAVQAPVASGPNVSGPTMHPRPQAPAPQTAPVPATPKTPAKPSPNTTPTPQPSGPDLGLFAKLGLTKPTAQAPQKTNQEVGGPKMSQGPQLPPSQVTQASNANVGQKPGVVPADLKQTEQEKQKSNVAQANDASKLPTLVQRLIWFNGVPPTDNKKPDSKQPSPKEAPFPQVAGDPVGSTKGPLMGEPQAPKTAPKVSSNDSQNKVTPGQPTKLPATLVNAQPKPAPALRGSAFKKIDADVLTASGSTRPGFIWKLPTGLSAGSKSPQPTPTVQQTPAQPTPNVQQKPVQPTATVQQTPVPPTPSVQQKPVQPTATVQQTPAQPTPSVQQKPVQPAITVQQIPAPPTPNVQQKPVQPAITVQQTPAQPTPNVQQKPVQPAITVQQIPAPPTPNVQQKPVQPAITVQQIPAQPTPTVQQKPVQPAITVQQIPAPPTPNVQQKPVQPAITVQQIPAPPTPNVQQKPVQPAITVQQAPAQPTPNVQQKPVQPAITVQQIPAQPTPNVQQKPVPPAITVQQTPAQPTPSVQQKPVQPTATVQQTPVQPFPTVQQVPIPPMPTVQQIPAIPAAAAKTNDPNDATGSSRTGFIWNLPSGAPKAMPASIPGVRAKQGIQPIGVAAKPAKTAAPGPVTQPTAQMPGAVGPNTAKVPAVPSVPVPTPPQPPLAKGGVVKPSGVDSPPPSYSGPVVPSLPPNWPQPGALPAIGGNQPKTATLPPKKLTDPTPAQPSVAAPAQPSLAPSTAVAGDEANRPGFMWKVNSGMPKSSAAAAAQPPATVNAQPVGPSTSPSPLPPLAKGGASGFLSGPSTLSRPPVMAQGQPAAPAKLNVGDLIKDTAAPRMPGLFAQPKDSAPYPTSLASRRWLTGPASKFGPVGQALAQGTQKTGPKNLKDPTQELIKLRDQAAAKQYTGPGPFTRPVASGATPLASAPSNTGPGPFSKPRPFSTSDGNGTAPPPPVAATDRVKPFPSAPPSSPLVIPMPGSSGSGDPLAPLAARKDWRKMWGKSPETQNMPGQSLVPPLVARKDKDRGHSGLLQTSKAMPPTSITEDDQPDILLKPERFNPPEKSVKGAGYAFVPKYDGNIQQVGAIQQVSFQGQPPVPTTQPMPIGVQSVLAARNGLQTAITYVPVPIVTVPVPVQPPLPPQAKVPEAPQLNNMVNAFSAPPSKDGQGQQQPMPQPMGQAAPGMMPQGQMPVMPVMYAPHHVPQSPAMATGQGYGYPMAHGQQRPGVPIQYPAQYHGPTPPNPMSGAQPTGYYPTPYAPQSQYMQPAMAPAPSPIMPPHESFQLLQLLQVLQESPYPGQREWAAHTLSNYNARTQPHVVQVLLATAKQDPVGSVRAACIYTLARMNVQDPSVVSTFQALSNDPDPRVRQEATQALQKMQ